MEVADLWDFTKNFPCRKSFYASSKKYSEIQGSKAKGLSHKQVAAFTQENVHNYFDKLKATVQAWNIPWENIYNFDEKGIQLSGGHKNTRTLYFFNGEDRIIIYSNLILCSLLQWLGEPVQMAPWFHLDLFFQQGNKFTGGNGKV